MTDCVDVCEIVTDKLIELGFEFIKPDDENHDDIIEALSQVEFVRKPEETS